MKKFLAVFLSALLIVLCLPFAAFAEMTPVSGGYEIRAVQGIAEDTTFEANKTYTVKSGSEFTVYGGATLTLPSGCKLIVEEGAVLNVEAQAYIEVIVSNLEACTDCLDEAELDYSVVSAAAKKVIIRDSIGVNALTRELSKHMCDIVSYEVGKAAYINCESGASIVVKGRCTGSANIFGAGSAVAEIRFPALADYNASGIMSVSYYSGKAGTHYDDVTENAQWTAVPVSGGKITVPLNRYLFIKAHIKNPGEGTENEIKKFDDSTYPVYFNEVRLPFGQGSVYTYVTSSGDVKYTAWPANADADFEKQFYASYSIYIPTGAGYQVIGDDFTTSQTNATVRLKYNDVLRFRVEINPDYSQSEDLAEVFLIDGYQRTEDFDLVALKESSPKLEKDEYGYYTTPNLSNPQGYTIYVDGVTKNETMNFIANLLESMRNIFTQIAEFFSHIFATLGINVA